MNRTLRLTVLGMVFAMIACALTAYAAAQTLNAVHTFVCKGLAGEGPCPDGGIPNAIIQASDGNFYGVTSTASQGSTKDGGLVFSLTPAGDFTPIFKFTPGTGNYSNGNDPSAIAEGPDGKLYGVTGVDGPGGLGTVFRLNKDGSGFQTLYSFQSNCVGGCDPETLLAGNDGNVYGLNFYSGTTKCYQCSSIFQINVATGKYKVVKIVGIDAYMVAGPDGTFYGTAENNLFHYNEVTNQITQSQLIFAKGINPAVAVLPTFGANGNIYGIYENFEKGVGVFEVQPSGANLQTFDSLPNFEAIEIRGSASMTLGSDGNLWMTRYGVTGAGDGEILTISPTDGSIIQTLTPFSATSAVGVDPEELIPATDGSLWGISSFDGETSSGYADGVVFNFTPNPGPR